MTKSLTDEEVIDRAERWARFHRKPETRSRMDDCLKGLTKADQRRVYLCGQRVVGGLAPKVIPAETEQRKEPDEKEESKSKSKSRKGKPSTNRS